MIYKETKTSGRNLPAILTIRTIVGLKVPDMKFWKIYLAKTCR